MEKVKEELLEKEQRELLKKEAAALKEESHAIPLNPD